MLISNNKQSGGVHVVNREEEERKGCGGKDLQKREVLSLE